MLNLKNIKSNKRGAGGDPDVISFKTMRTAVGILAFSLPVLCVIVYTIIGQHGFHPLDSISEYYYTCSRNIFVGILCMVGLFLYAYRGYNRVEDTLFNILSVLCVLIAIFPMNPLEAGTLKPVCCCYDFQHNDYTLIMHRCWFTYIHFGSATVLFCSLGYVSAYLFTISSSKDHHGLTPQKKKRNKLYKVCGWAIWIALGIYAIYMIFDHFMPDQFIIQFLTNHSILLVVETICLFSFGLSWLVKGEAISPLNDK